MQDISELPNLMALFLKRKHKLLKSLTQTYTQYEDEASSKDVAALYEALMNKDNQVSQISYFIKH
jgi:hypothetical protein